MKTLKNPSRVGLVFLTFFAIHFFSVSSAHADSRDFYLVNLTIASFEVVCPAPGTGSVHFMFGFTPDPNSWNPENISHSHDDFYSSPLFWHSVSLPEIPGNSFVYFCWSDLPDRIYTLKLPSSTEIPQTPSFFYSARATNISGQPLEENSGIVLARLIDGNNTSSYIATPFSGDENQINFAISNLYAEFGKLEAGKEILFGSSVLPVPTVTLEMLLFSPGRKTATCQAIIVDPANGITNPVASDFIFELTSPQISLPASSTSLSNSVYWSEVTDAESYTLQRLAPGASSWITILTTGSEIFSYTDNVSSYGQYSYRIKAEESISDSESSWSDIASISIISPPQNAPILQGSYTFNSDVPTISWQSVYSSEGIEYWYEVEWSGSQDFSNSTLVVTSQNSVTLNLEGYTYIYIRIRTILPDYSEGLFSPWSASSGAVIELGSPVLAISSESSTARYSAQWTEVEAIPAGSSLSYELQISQFSSFDGASTEYSGEQTLFASILPEGGTWYFRVRAVCSSTYSNWSEAISVSFSPTEVTTPKDLVAIPSTNSIELRWTISYCTSTTHRISRSTEGGSFEIISNSVQGDRFTDNGVSEFTQYEYKVIAVGEDKEYVSTSVITRTSEASGIANLSSAALMNSTGPQMVMTTGESSHNLPVIERIIGMAGSYWSSGIADASVGLSNSTATLIDAKKIATDLYVAIFTAEDEVGLAGLYSVFITDSTTGLTISSEPQKISSYYSNVIAARVVTGYPNAAAIVYFDTLTHTYYAVFTGDWLTFSEPYAAFSSLQMDDPAFHLPACTIDTDGNLHIAALSFDGTIISLRYGFNLIIETISDEPNFSSFTEQTALSMSSDATSMVGMSINGVSPTVSWIEGTELRRITGSYKTSGFQWGLDDLVLSSVFAAWEITTSETPIYMFLRTDEITLNTMLGYCDYYGSSCTYIDMSAEITSPCAEATSSAYYFTYLNENGELIYAEYDLDVSSSVSESSGGGGGCFIATAAFGSYLSSSVTSLCEFRDTAVMKSALGSTLTSLYYTLSPALAKELGKSNALKVLVTRIGLSLTN